MSEHSIAPVDGAMEYVPVHVLMGRVLADLPAIGKDDQAPAKMGGYHFRGIEAITAALKPLLAKYGVFCVPTTLERLQDKRPTSGGGTLWIVDVHVRFTFFGPGGDWLEASAWGQGSDSGDKATQKAYTAAFKSLLAIAFCIADAETDAERHDVPDTADVADSETVSALAERVNALPANHRADFRQQWLDSEALKPHRLQRLPVEHVSLVEAMLAGVEARVRAEQPSDGTGATETGALLLGGAQTPDGSSDAQRASQQAEAEQLLNADPPDEWVRSIIDETASMGAEAVDTELRMWSLPKGGNLDTRRRRLALAKVRDALRPPS